MAKSKGGWQWNDGRDISVRMLQKHFTTKEKVMTLINLECWDNIFSYQTAEDFEEFFEKIHPSETNVEYVYIPIAGMLVKKSYGEPPRSSDYTSIAEVMEEDIVAAFIYSPDTGKWHKITGSQIDDTFTELFTDPRNKI